MDMVGSRVERGVVHQLERLFGHGTVTGLSEEQLLDRFATPVEGLAGDGGSSRSEPVAAVLRDEERPLVHEEVNRLPRKYRTPIVLCYFEGLTV